MCQQEFKSRHSNLRIAVGIVVAIFGLLCPFIGCAIGGSFGYQQGYGNTIPEGKSVLYDSRHPPSQMPQFWVVQYPVEHDATSQPRLIEIADPDLKNAEWYFGPPLIQNRLTVGPWEKLPPWAEQSDREWGKPLGDLEVVSGGVRFKKIDNQTIRIELILYPVDREDGWTRWYYIYELQSGSVVPVQLKREYQTSDWAIDTVVFYSFAGAVVGVVFGFIFLFAGIIMCVFQLKSIK